MTDQWLCNISLKIARVKDKTKEYREPSEEEIKLYCRPKKNIATKPRTVKQGNATSSTLNSADCKETKKTSFKKPERIKEKKLVITVKKNEVDKDKDKTDEIKASIPEECNLENENNNTKTSEMSDNKHTSNIENNKSDSNIKSE